MRVLRTCCCFLILGVAVGDVAAMTRQCFPLVGADRRTIYTAEACCANGGLASCFQGSFSFQRCCPDYEGMDPTQCWAIYSDGIRFAMESWCCRTQVKKGSRCFDRTFTYRSCCRFASEYPTLPSFDLMLPAMTSREAIEDASVQHIFAKAYFEAGLTGPCVEVGVQVGNFSRFFLAYLQRLGALQLPDYYMVDKWQHAPKGEWYEDSANVGNRQQIKNMGRALEAVLPFWDSIKVLKMSSLEAARVFPDNSLAFIYLDARHDYCAVRDEMHAYWPKLQEGGIMAGDDYGKAIPDDRYSHCADGSYMPGAVRRAVNEFAQGINEQHYVFGQQWVLVKPRR